MRREDVGNVMPNAGAISTNPKSNKMRFVQVNDKELIKPFVCSSFKTGEHCLSMGVDIEIVRLPGWTNAYKQ